MKRLDIRQRLNKWEARLIRDNQQFGYCIGDTEKDALRNLGCLILLSQNSHVLNNHLRKVFFE